MKTKIFSPPINILYLGAFAPHCSDRYRVVGLQDSGLYNVTYEDYRVQKKNYNSGFKSYIAKIIKDKDIQVILMNKAECISVQEITYWKETFPELVIAYWYGDMRNELAPFVKEKLSIVDLFFMNNDDNNFKKELGFHGILPKQIHYSHTATDLRVFEKDMSVIEKYDIVFFGGQYGGKFRDSEHRVQMIKKLVLEDEYKIKVYGKGWDIISGIERSSVVYGDNFARAASEAKIILGFSSFINVNLYTSNRMWNCMACGFYLTHKFKGISQIFKNKEQLVWFSSYGEMKEQIDYYLQNYDERLKIHKSGRESISKKHTYTQRAVEMFPKFMESIKEKHNA